MVSYPESISEKSVTPEVIEEYYRIQYSLCWLKMYGLFLLHFSVLQQIIKTKWFCFRPKARLTFILFLTTSSRGCLGHRWEQLHCTVSLLTALRFWSSVKEKAVSTNLDFDCLSIAVPKNLHLSFISKMYLVRSSSGLGHLSTSAVEQTQLSYLYLCEIFIPCCTSLVGEEISVVFRKEQVLWGCLLLLC